MSRENEPWCPCSVYTPKMVVKKGPLPGRIAVVMLSAHHHHMDRAKVKSIPIMVTNLLIKLSHTYKFATCNLPRLVWSRPRHSKSIDVGNVTLPTRVMTLIECTGVQKQQHTTILHMNNCIHLYLLYTRAYRASEGLISPCPQPARLTYSEFLESLS